MGSVCCVAVKDRKVPPSGVGGVGGSGVVHRNSVCSPQWSFRRDNRRRVADEIEGSPYYSPYVASRGISMDKMSLGGSERGTLSGGGTPPDGHFGTPASQKSVALEMSAVPLSSGSSLASHDLVEVKSLVDSSSIVPSAQPKALSSTPSLSTPVSDLSSTYTRLLPPRSTPSRRARRSPGHQLFRQVSDSQILGLKSPTNNNYSVSEGRSSFVLSTCSNDFATGSNYASSEGGWSLNTFSELVAYSQRERWSFDSEHFGSGRRKLSGGSSRFSFSPSVVDQQICGACSKLLTERSSIANFELPIAAVLVCGHVYHAECLETMTTTEIEKYDPACPICTIGEKRVAKITRKALKAEAEAKAKHYKRCKNRVVDSYGESECDEFMFQKTGKREGKALKLEPSCSSKGPSKSFLKWHFASISSKWNKPSSKDSALKKGFWSRHRNNRSPLSIEGLNQTTQL